MNLHLIEDFIENVAKIKSGVNKKEELKRLIYEILIREKISIEVLIKRQEINNILKSPIEGTPRFLALKEELIKIRYPETVKSQEKFTVYLPRIKVPLYKIQHFDSEFKPERIFIQKSVCNTPLSQRIINTWKNIPVEIFDSIKDIKFDKERMLKDMGKRDIYIVEESFDIIKPCPCTKNAFCCGYVILNLGFGCPYDCSYCYLQHYANLPGIFLPANLETFFKQAKNILKKIKKRIRIGTGEFCDSLALDPFTSYSKDILEFVKDLDLVFEFKTKSDKIENLLEKPPLKNVVISWSLNPDSIVSSEELYTANLYERLNAAKKVINHGYRVGFHFDPVIYYPEWEKDYSILVKEIFNIAKGKIAWISLGTLRFYRELKTIVEQRFPEDPVFYGEFLLDPSDNKMRYPASIREKIFKFMLENIRLFDQDVPVYLCMEDENMWKRVFKENFSSVKKELQHKLTEY